MPTDLVPVFMRAVETTDGLAEPALAMARLDCPMLDPAPYIARLDQMGSEVSRRLRRAVGPRRARRSRTSVEVIGSYLFGEIGLAGNEETYEDPRNSFLNEVLDRKLGIPISLGVIYIEVARRAGLSVDGINFPGRFLLSCPVDAAEAGEPVGLVVDPFNGGVILTERECRELLFEQVGDELPFHPALLSAASRKQILGRMLLNLKRSYVSMRSFPQARQVTELLVALSPSALDELRDRGLIAYHLKDFPAALKDLESYLTLSKSGDSDEEREERDRIWEHVKSLRRRVAALN